MIISPPFLPQRGNRSEDDWIDYAMSGGLPGAGAYPVSHRLEWHGGLHLLAPLGSDRLPLPVCAIADGSVVFVRQRTSADSPEEPLNYGDGYTSDAVVVLRHETEIGADAQGTATAMRFYSVYMHLHSIRPTVVQGRRIYRKDEIGQAGHIYGTPNVLHFEICCDDANLARLVGRTTGSLSTAADGRTDAVYGRTYFLLPAGTPVYPSQPLPQFAEAMTPPSADSQQASGAPAPEHLQSFHITSEELIVALRYANGDATLETYHPDGRKEHNFVSDLGVEYELYGTANAISAACPASSRPAPSAVYELLRLGRVLGADTLDPASLPHWRQVACSAGVGWVNLNAANVRKFSDADFPHWGGWTLIDDDANGDSRCDSLRLRQMVYDGGNATLLPSREQAFQQLCCDAVRARMRRVIAKFPSEWDASTIDKRWSWLKTADAENQDPMTEDDYADFRAHAEALCFPLAELFQAQWRFDPREFIRHFRQCTWLSQDEFRQLQPSHAVRTGKKNGQTAVFWERVDPMIPDAVGVPVRYRNPLNKMMRKYGINTGTRMAAFFGNAIQETQWLSSLTEGSGSTLWYAPWYGRGFLQLTNPENYCGYWAWRGRTVPAALQKALVDAYKTIAAAVSRTNAELQDSKFPALTRQIAEWRADVLGSTAPDPTSEQLVAPADSAGYYWAKLKMAKYADEPHDLDRHHVSTDGGFKVYYRSPAFWRASAAVNLPGAVSNIYSLALNGFDSRCSAYGVALAVLTEMRFPSAEGCSQLPYPEGYTVRRP
jgi:predicted chitinase